MNDYFCHWVEEWARNERGMSKVLPRAAHPEKSDKHNRRVHASSTEVRTLFSLFSRHSIQARPAPRYPSSYPPFLEISRGRPMHRHRHPEEGGSTWTPPLPSPSLKKQKKKQITWKYYTTTPNKWQMKWNGFSPPSPVQNTS